MTFEQSLRTREFEPDGPNYTPRISGIMHIEDGLYNYALSILKSNNGNPEACNRYTCLLYTSQEKQQEAEVVAVGPGGVVDGKEVTMQVKAGDKVIYSKYAGNEVKLDDVEYIIVKQSDILAIVE